MGIYIDTLFFIKEKRMKTKKVEKTIATCTPSEFMAQGYRLAGKVKALFEMAGIAEIRKRLPEYKEEDTPEERKEKHIVFCYVIA